MDFSGMAKILKINLRHNFLPHFGIALIIALLTPAAFSISALDVRASAQPLEMLLSLTGAVLLTPVFLPEQNADIQDVIRSKRVDYLSVCAVRAVYSAAFLAAIVGIFTLVMKLCESSVSVYHFSAGYASALFLGAVGFAVSGISGSITAGYMSAMIYYIANFGLKDKLGIFFLFGMYFDGREEVRWELLLMSIAIIIMTFVFMKIREKLR